MRTIRTVIDTLSAERIECETLLDRDDNLAFVRKAIAESRKLGHARYVCDLCKGPLTVNDGGPHRKSFFEHKDRRTDCEWWRGEIPIHRGQIYAGKPESEAHKRTRSAIYSALRCDDRFTNIKVEKWVLDEKGGRRRPDLACNFLGKELHIEVQVSPIALQDVLARQTFSKTNSTYLLWIMDDQNKLDQHSSLRELATLNLFNASVFDHEAAINSQRRGRVTLKALCPKFDSAGLPIEWRCYSQDFSELRFDPFYSLLYWQSGYKSSALALLASERQTVSRFRKLISQCHANDDCHELQRIFLHLAQKARLSSVTHECEFFDYRMLLIACECIRRRRKEAASYKEQDVFWAINAALNKQRNFAPSLERIVASYWPQLWDFEASKKPMQKLRECADELPNREINRLLRFLYPKAAHFLPLA